MSSQTLPETFRLRAGNFNLLVLRLLDPRPQAVLPALGDQFRRAPGFLRFAPIVIGLADLVAAPEEVDFRGLIEGLHALEIVPIGTTGGSPQMRQVATAAGLPPLRAVGGRDDGEVPAAAAPDAAAPAMPPTAAPLPQVQGSGRSALVVTEPVRSGQRIYAENADIIVTATVNPGGEVIADGHVHVYGALRGRAIAGARNDPEARIFALNFDPELIAIAGFYTVREGLGQAPIGRATQVRLEGEEMRFGPLG